MLKEVWPVIEKRKRNVHVDLKRHELLMLLNNYKSDIDIKKA